MDDFRLRQQTLHAEAVPLEEIAAAAGTPTYVYSRHTLLDHLTRLRAAWGDVTPSIRYAVKANSNLAILRLLADASVGFDVVSRGEIDRVLAVGADPATIDFAGVGKRDDEIDHALTSGVGTLNVESEVELAAVTRRAAHASVVAAIALRVNPDVDARTHRHITTGREENKFGIAAGRVAAIADGLRQNAHVRLAGLHLHVGSQLTDPAPYAEAVLRVAELVGQLRAAGVHLDHLNLGGGFGIHYVDEEAPAMSAFANVAVPLVRDLGLEIRLEPGRILIGNAGVLLTRALYVKETDTRRFVICDAGMNDLIRPSLYDAFHRIEPVTPRPGAALPADIVGPICETADTFGRGRALPPILPGDLLCIRSAGAYGFSLSSQYNSRPRAAEVLVDGSRFGIVRERETTADLLRNEHLEARWLTPV